jgi:polyisoprenoid-binding protein YceI
MNTRQIFLGTGIISGLALCMALARPLPPASPAESAPSAGVETYAVDSVHSTVIFRVKHLGVSYAYGRFDEISGSVTLDAEKPESSKVKLEVKTASIDTGNGKRDGHLKSPDFFDAKQFATATFTSKTVKAAGDKKYSVSGELNLHGVTKPVTVEMEIVGKGKGMEGEDLAGFYGTFTIKRSDFGMKFMTDKLGDDIVVTVSLEGDKQP